MTRAPSLKLRAYLLLTAAGTLAALALGRPELVALVAPFAVYVGVGAARAAEPAVEVLSELDRGRILEGEEVTVTVDVRAGRALDSLDLWFTPGAGLQAVGAARRRVRLGAGERRQITFVARPPRWGGYRIGVVTCRAGDRFGLLEYELPPVVLGSVRVFPRVDQLRALFAPTDLQATAGSRVSSSHGEGIEFAEVRPFMPGDRIRRVNWRATARRGTPFLSERHPERNADVILFLDPFAEVRDASASTLTLAVRAAATLAAGYLARKDRVGVVRFGGVLRGLGPGLGAAQLYRILEALIGSEVVFSYAHKDASFIPRKLLPPKALVIAITPLIDQRSIRALLDLRARGFDLAALDVSPVSLAAPGPTRSDAVAHRLWVLRRAALRTRLERLGVSVSEWRGDQPLQAPVASAAGFRRRMTGAVAA